MTAQSPLPAPPAEGLYLQLVLDRSLPALLPAPQLVEILSVAIGQVVPIFQLPPWVMGVYNRRGEVLWVVDLNHLMGLTPWYAQVNYGSHHTVVVLQEPGKAKEKAIVGLVVNRVEEVVQCTADRLHSWSEYSRSEDSRSEDSRSELAESSSALEVLGQNFVGQNLPANLHRFISGYWQDENAPTYWLLNGAAILQSLSELSS